MNFDDLRKPFPPAEVSWRVGTCGKKGDGFWAQLLAYIDNRNIMDRLDTVCGPEHWSNEFRAGPSGGVICGISIEVAPDKWVTKWDGAENTEIESVKGGLSDSMKRAANQWGIGRYLYDLGETWADCSPDRKHGWHYGKTKDNSVFYWSVPRDALVKLGGEPPEVKTPPAKPAPPKPPIPEDKEGNFDHVGYFRKKIAIENNASGLDAALVELKQSKPQVKDEYVPLLREWFERAIDTAEDNDRVQVLDGMLAKAKSAIGEPAFVKLGAALDRKYQRTVPA